MPERVLLSSAARAQLLSAMQAEAPDEVVGLLGGRADALGWRVDTFLRLPTRSASPDHFTVAADAFIAGERCLHRQGHVWLGFAHSHPRGRALPSSTDHRALWRDCVHLIAAPGPGRPEVGAFRFVGDRCETLALERA